MCQECTSSIDFSVLLFTEAGQSEAVQDGYTADSTITSSLHGSSDTTSSFQHSIPNPKLTRPPLHSSNLLRTNSLLRVSPGVARRISADRNTDDEGKTVRGETEYAMHRTRLFGC